MKHNLASAVSRREFIRRGAAGTVGAALSLGLGQLGQAAPSKRIPVGLQLYSLRVECKDNLPGMLAAVSRIGYKGVEFAGYHGRNAMELRRMLDANGLTACGTHTPFDSIQGDKLKETIAFNAIIGNRFLIVPWMNETKSKQEWLDRAKLFNDVAAKVKEYGMWVGYHAHAHDFHQINGVSAWDLFFGNTSTDVIMQLDTSNCREGGANPVAVLKKYPGRARSIHVKCYGAGPEGVIGQGDVDWKEVFTFCEHKGKTQWYVVEHETSKNPLDAVTRSYAALQKLGKV